MSDNVVRLDVPWHGRVPPGRVRAALRREHDDGSEIAAVVRAPDGTVRVYGSSAAGETLDLLMRGEAALLSEMAAARLDTLGWPRDEGEWVALEELFRGLVEDEGADGA